MKEGLVTLPELKQLLETATKPPWTYEELSQMVWARSVEGASSIESMHMIADVRGWGHLGYLLDGSEMQKANGKLLAASRGALPLLVAIAEKAKELVDATMGDETLMWLSDRVEALDKLLKELDPPQSEANP